MSDFRFFFPSYSMTNVHTLTFQQAAIIQRLYFTLLVGAFTVYVCKPSAVLSKPPNTRKAIRKRQLRNSKHPSALQRNHRNDTCSSIFSYQTVAPPPHKKNTSPPSSLSQSNRPKILLRGALLPPVHTSPQCPRQGVQSSHLRIERLLY